MEAIRKQASKLREQVAKQQQSILKQFSGRFGHDTSLVDETELQCHQKLQMLYASTKAAKHLQRDIARGVEAFIVINCKQMEIVKKLSEDCYKYGNEYQSSGFELAKASLDFATSHALIEKEQDSLLRILGEKVFEPLRVMIMGAPLEDARLLTYRYERIRHDVETQTTEVIRRHLKSKEDGTNVEAAAKIQKAESKLSELRTILSALGREATAAMLSVEAQQQENTFQRLLTMVDAERAYHQNATSILDKLHDEMVLMRQHHESVPESTKIETTQSPTSREDPMTNHSSNLLANGTMTSHSNDVLPDDAKTIQSDCPIANDPDTGQYDDVKENGLKVNEPVDLIERDPKDSQSDDSAPICHDPMYFVAEIVHPFDAQAEGELSLSVGDYVVVRQVAANGWSEGECKGKAGWFPSAYIEHRDKAPASKVIEPNLLTLYHPED